MISHKNTLHETHDAPKWRKAPRCTPKLARLYRCKQHLTDADIGRLNRGTDRRARVFQCSAHLLSALRPCARLARPLVCDRYLIDAVYRWLLGCCRTPDSWTTYGAAIQDWTAWSLKRSLHRQVDTVPRELGDYLRQLEAEQLAPRTIALRRDVLRSWFAWLVDLGLMVRSPVNREIRRSWRIDHEALVIHGGSRQVLTLAQGKRLATWAMREAHSEAGFSVLLQASAGLRSAEVANAYLVDWVEGEAGVVSLMVHGKGRKVRTIVLEPVVVDAGRRYFAEHRRTGKRGPLIARPGGGHYSARRIQQWAEAGARAIDRHGEISSHSLRATASTLLMEDGAHLEQVSKQLGHASIVHTARCYVVRRRPLAARTGITVESPP